MISFGEDLYLKRDVMLSDDIFEKLWVRCGMFNIKDNKRDKVINIIKGQRLSYRN